MTTFRVAKDTWDMDQPFPINDGHKNLGPCPTCGKRTFNYGGGWRCLGLQCVHNESNPASGMGPRPAWWDRDVCFDRDGDMWMASRPGFINIQESDCGFGETTADAARDLLSSEGN